MIRLGLLGCGFVAALHSRGLKALVASGLVDARVVATCDTDLERAEVFARAHGAEVATGDPSELLTKVDAVLVCTPTATHRPLVEEAAATGVAVLCEKPLATTYEDAVAIAAAVTKAGVIGQVGLVLRFSPVLQELVALVHGGRLGRPMTVVFRDDQYFPVQGQYASSWRGDVAVAGGGTLLEHSIHDLDILQWLLGDVEQVGAVIGNYAGFVGVEDLAVATLRFGSGALASLTSVWHQVLTRPSTRRIEVVGEHGLAWLEDEHTGPLHVQTDDGHVVRECPYATWAVDLPIADPWRPHVVPYAIAARGFLDSVAAGRPAEPDLSVAVAAHRVADAIYRSARDGGRPVGLALL